MCCCACRQGRLLLCLAPPAACFGCALQDNMTDQSLAQVASFGEDTWQARLLTCCSGMSCTAARLVGTKANRLACVCLNCSRSQSQFKAYTLSTSWILSSPANLSESSTDAKFLAMFVSSLLRHSQGLRLPEVIPPEYRSPFSTRVHGHHPNAATDTHALPVATISTATQLAVAVPSCPLWL